MAIIKTHNAYMNKSKNQSKKVSAPETRKRLAQLRNEAAAIRTVHGVSPHGISGKIAAAQQDDCPDDGPDGFELPDGTETWEGSYNSAAPQSAKAAQVGIQPRICVEGHDYMLVAEHYAVVNDAIAAELHKTSQRDDAQDAVLDQTVKLNKAETELERVKGQLDSVRADAKNFRRLLDQEREELANVMVENVLLEEKLEAAIAKAEGRAS